MNLNSMKNWKNVKEEHPFSEFGESKSVLTVDTHGLMRVLYWDGGNWCWPSGEAVKTTNIAPITHWIDLPTPPSFDKPTYTFDAHKTPVGLRLDAGIYD